MQASGKCITMIEGFEGDRRFAYPDARGQWTIGYGHTAGVKAGNSCSPAQAQVWLQEDVSVAAAAINRLVAVPLNQNQFDALVSLVFNIGIGAFQQSTLRRNLNEMRYDAASLQFLVWTRAGRWHPLGLWKRRQAERALFNTP